MRNRRRELQDCLGDDGGYGLPSQNDASDTSLYSCNSSNALKHWTASTVCRPPKLRCPTIRCSKRRSRSAGGDGTRRCGSLGDLLSDEFDDAEDNNRCTTIHKQMSNQGRYAVNCLLSASSDDEFPASADNQDDIEVDDDRPAVVQLLSCNSSFSDCSLPRHELITCGPPSELAQGHIKVSVRPPKTSTNGKCFDDDRLNIKFASHFVDIPDASESASDDNRQDTADNNLARKSSSSLTRKSSSHLGKKSSSSLGKKSSSSLVKSSSSMMRKSSSSLTEKASYSSRGSSQFDKRKSSDASRSRSSEGRQSPLENNKVSRSGASRTRSVGEESQLENANDMKTVSDKSSRTSKSWWETSTSNEDVEEQEKSRSSTRRSSQPVSRKSADARRSRSNVEQPSFRNTSNSSRLHINSTRSESKQPELEYSSVSNKNMRKGGTSKHWWQQSSSNGDFDDDESIEPMSSCDDDEAIVKNVWSDTQSEPWEEEEITILYANVRRIIRGLVVNDPTDIKSLPMSEVTVAEQDKETLSALVCITEPPPLINPTATSSTDCDVADKHRHSAMRRLQRDDGTNKNDASTTARVQSTAGKHTGKDPCCRLKQIKLQNNPRDKQDAKLLSSKMLTRGIRAACVPRSTGPPRISDNMDGNDDLIELLMPSLPQPRQRQRHTLVEGRLADRSTVYSRRSHSNTSVSRELGMFAAADPPGESDLELHSASQSSVLANVDADSPALDRRRSNLLASCPLPSCLKYSSCAIPTPHIGGLQRPRRIRFATQVKRYDD